MRGEFRRADGLVIPNNLSLYASEYILRSFCRNDVAPTFYAGLVKGVPTPLMTKLDMLEPTVGTHGYARIQVTRDVVGWPDFGNVGQENFLGTKDLVWTAAGGNFDQAVTRIAMFDTNAVDSANKIFALSAPLAAEFTITPTTPVEQRTFQYRLYL